MRKYDNIFILCVSLTIHHVRKHPLRAQDDLQYDQMLNRIPSIGAERVEKRRRVQERYRQRRRSRLDSKHRVKRRHNMRAGSHDDESN